MKGSQINYLRRWLGHSLIHPTLTYLKVVLDSLESLDRLPWKTAPILWSVSIQSSLTTRPRKLLFVRSQVSSYSCSII